MAASPVGQRQPTVFATCIHRRPPNAPAYTDNCLAHLSAKQCHAGGSSATPCVSVNLTWARRQLATKDFFRTLRPSRHHRFPQETVRYDAQVFSDHLIRPERPGGAVRIRILSHQNAKGSRPKQTHATCARPLPNQIEITQIPIPIGCA